MYFFEFNNFFRTYILWFFTLILGVCSSKYFLFVYFVFEDQTETHSKTKQQLGKRERSRDGTDLEDDPTSKKSRSSESWVPDVNQSTSMSANDPPVHDLVFEQQPCTSQHRIRCDTSNSIPSGTNNADQQGI